MPKLFSKSLCKFSLNRLKAWSYGVGLSICEVLADALACWILNDGLGGFDITVL
jgi:hypothetical protein